MVYFFNHILYVFLCVNILSSVCRRPLFIDAGGTTESEMLIKNMELRREMRRYLECKDVNLCDKILVNVIKLSTKETYQEIPRILKRQPGSEETSSFFKVSSTKTSEASHTVAPKNINEDTNRRSVFKWG